MKEASEKYTKLRLSGKRTKREAERWPKDGCQHSKGVRSLELSIELGGVVGVHWQQRVRAAQLGRRDKQEARDLSQADRVPIAFPDLGGIEAANH